MTVGRSCRSQYKHFLLDKYLGKVSGALWTGNTFARAPLHCVDLCAGDGIETDLHRASPMIFEKHCRHKCGRSNQATLDLIEWDKASFDLLVQNVGCHEWVTVTHGDARKYRLPPMDDRQAVFIHCDPNNAHQTPLTEEFVSGFTKCTTYIVTLGCNPDGLKRLPIDQRILWRDYVDILVEKLPRWHDALLFWLMKDAAQWAYLVSIPDKWRDNFLSMAVTVGDKMWPKGVGGTSFRLNPSNFVKQLERLFLTSEELTGQMRLW